MCNYVAYNRLLQTLFLTFINVLHLFSHNLIYPQWLKLTEPLIPLDRAVWMTLWPSDLVVYQEFATVSESLLNRPGRALWLLTAPNPSSRYYKCCTLPYIGLSVAGKSAHSRQSSISWFLGKIRNFHSCILISLSAHCNNPHRAGMFDNVA